jgi:hypothetical protein
MLLSWVSGPWRWLVADKPSWQSNGPSVRFVSPFDPLRHLPFNAMAVAHFTRGGYEQAAAASRNAIESNPPFSLLHAMLAASLVRLGQLEAAKRTAARVLVLQPSFKVGATLRSLGVLPPEVAASIGEAWRQAGMPEE